MGYPITCGHNAFFTPVAGLAAGAITVLEELDIGATAGDHGEMLCIVPCAVKRFWFVPVTEAASGTTTDPAVIFTKRPTPGSATGEAVVGTLNVPSGTGIGVPVYLDVNPNDVYFQTGDSLEISWTVGVGTPTGIGHWGLEAYESSVHKVAITGAVASS